MIILLAGFASAQNDHINLLAVSETGVNGTHFGQIVDLYLEMYPAQGRIFIDSYPLTKMDTQVSTRYSNRFACDYTNIDCSNIDFIYTIRSNSPMIGGPSASAAIAAITTAKLLDADIDDEVALTGTLNSGGFIGPVGGVKEKVLAAKRANLKKVLIPKGSKFSDDVDLNFSTLANMTFNWTQFGIDNGIEVIEVLTIDEVLYHFGIVDKLKEQSKDIEPDGYYVDIMKDLAIDLCDRAQEAYEKINNSNVTMDADELRQRGQLFFSMKKYYAGASQCFASLSRYGYYDFLKQNMTESQINKTIDDWYVVFDNYTIPDYTTITDMQAYAVVKERLIDAKTSLARARTQSGDKKLETLSYSIERFNTAKSWSNFITHDGAVFDSKNDSLKSVCSEMLQEAQELVQYVDLYVPNGIFGEQKKSFESARDYYNDGEYSLCLFKASKSKAESNLVLNLLGVEQDDVKDIVDVKLDSILEIMNSNTNSFPIVGYSYYEYSKALNEVNDSSSALLYAEYALELSNMNLYFNGENSHDTYDFQNDDLTQKLIIFGLGFILGSLCVLFLWAKAIDIRRSKRRKKHGHKSK